ncbi:hypothetical protein [Yersinia ruckeri]|uniref:hypothetical protein n=1 Tax=Yersinia ruckeri TaxID=29486 RepID=UPI00226454F1|nr:hypothetical protein [Yersinia ruckeri]UZX69501.1 hypothetical protein ND437_05510 [Yersinia ruckeri]
MGEVIAAAADALKKSANLSDLTNKPQARENIGLPGVLENYARSDTFRVTDTASRVVSPTGKFFAEVGDAGSLLFYDTAKNKEIFKVIPTGEITVGSIKASSVTGLREFGVSQRWKDVSGQRGYSVTYTNASALPIMICIEFQSPASTTNVVNVNGVVAGGVNTSSAQPQIGFIVTVVPPNGEYVLIRILGTSTTVTRWSELS